MQVWVVSTGVIQEQQTHTLVKKQQIQQTIVLLESILTYVPAKMFNFRSEIKFHEYLVRQHYLACHMEEDYDHSILNDKTHSSDASEESV